MCVYRAPPVWAIKRVVQVYPCREIKEGPGRLFLTSVLWEQVACAQDLGDSRSYDLVPQHPKKYLRLLSCQGVSDDPGHISQKDIRMVAETIEPDQLQAFNAALSWVSGGMKSIFIQDANSLIIKPADLVEILKHLKKRFSQVERITSYARSHTEPV